MKCPFCGFEEDKVVESRISRGGEAVRRRRECLSCARRFTTYEYVEKSPLLVVKRDGRREPFERQKLLNGILTACRKRPIPKERIESIVDDIESTLSNPETVEVSSQRIGEEVIRRLRNLDQVSYVRFASVYRRFEEPSEFVEELTRLSTPARSAKKPARTIRKIGLHKTMRKNFLSPSGRGER